MSGVVEQVEKVTHWWLNGQVSDHEAMVMIAERLGNFSRAGLLNYTKQEER